MSDAFWTNLPSTILALGSLLTILIGILNTRKLNRQAGSIEAIHKATNSMKDDLIKVTGEAEHAKGKLEGERGRS